MWSGFGKGIIILQFNIVKASIAISKSTKMKINSFLIYTSHLINNFRVRHFSEQNYSSNIEFFTTLKDFKSSMV